jgi:hypothetical protein
MAHMLKMTAIKSRAPVAFIVSLKTCYSSLHSGCLNTTNIAPGDSFVVRRKSHMIRMCNDCAAYSWAVFVEERIIFAQSRRRIGE